jgi:hypothetical protein
MDGLVAAGSAREVAASGDTVTAEVGSATEGLVVAGSAREAAATATAERCSLARHSSAPQQASSNLCALWVSRALCG